MTSYIRIPVPEGMAPDTLSAALMQAQVITEESQPQEPFSFTKGLILGIQAGDFLEHAYQPAGIPNAMTQADFDRCVAIGFDHFRIPANCSARASLPGVVPDAFMQTMKAQVDMAQKALKDAGKPPRVILDYNHHNNPRRGDGAYISNWPAGIQSLTEANHASRDTAIAVQVATFFKDYDENLAFDLFNEPGQAAPGKGLTPDELNAWHASVIPAIRACGGYNANRWVLLEPHSGNLNSLKIPEGGRVIASPHIYNPFIYTHQGAQEITAIGLSEYQVNVRAAKQWADERGVDLLIGEAGVKKGKKDRPEFIRHIRECAVAECVPTCIWDYASLFGLYDRANKAWFPGMLEAVQGKGPEVRDFIQLDAVDIKEARLYNPSKSDALSFKDGLLTIAPNSGPNARQFMLAFPKQKLERWAKVFPETQSPTIGYEPLAFVSEAGKEREARFPDGKSSPAGWRPSSGAPVEFMKAGQPIEKGAYLGVRIEQKAGDPGITTRLSAFVK